MGIEAESGGEVFTVEAEQIVVSSGAIASPQLLMLSGIGPSDHLQSFGIPVVLDSSGVGKNLRDHPSAAVIFRAAGDRPDLQAPVIQVGLRYTVEGSPLRNDMQLSAMLMTSEHRPAHIQIDDDLNYIAMGASLQLALGQGELTLQSTDPHQQPFLNYNYYQEEEDLRRMREAIRLGASIGEHPAFKDILIERIMPTDDELASDRRAGRLAAAQLGHVASHIGYLQDGSRFRSHGGCGPVPQCEGHRGPARRRRVGHAGLHSRQHECHHE